MASTYADPGLLKTIQQKNREVEKKTKDVWFHQNLENQRECRETESGPDPLISIGLR